MAKGIVLWHFGILFVGQVFCQDCAATRQYEPVYKNSGMNVTFSLHSENQCCLEISVDKRSNTSIQHIFHLSVRHLILCEIPFVDTAYKGRVFCSFSDTTNNVTVTIVNTSVLDGGEYKMRNMFEGQTWCFMLFVLGEPTAVLQTNPVVLEEGCSGYTECFMQSTTVPKTHNFTLSASWFINGIPAEQVDRFHPESNKLYFYFLTRDDDNMQISCKVNEQYGLTAWINESLQIYWGPADEPNLIPSNTFYHVHLGENIPDIRCSIDCKPKCDVSWTRPESGHTSSTNGILSLDLARENTTGEYVCIATGNGSHKRATKSIYILLQEINAATSVSVGNDDVNTTAPVVTTGVLSGVAVLLSTGVLVMLLRRKLCTRKSCTETDKESPVSESTTQNRMYEDLHETRNVQENYDAVSLGPVDCSDRNSDIQRNAGSVIYENNTLN